MSYLLFQMALYMLATLILGFILGWYVWGNLFEEGNVLGKLGFASNSGGDGAAGSELAPKLEALERKNADLEAQLAGLSSARKHLEDELDACKSARAKLETDLAKAAPAPAVMPAAAPKQKPQPDPEPVQNAFLGGDEIGKKPEGLTAPRGGQADNLKLIKGIGPKLEAMLHGMGFYHFDQIASWGEEELAWVDENLEGFKGRASRDKWINQAKALA